MTKIRLVMFMTLLLIISACESTQAEHIEKVVMYENEKAGIQILESSNWMLDSEVSTEPFNVTFKQDEIRAIVSIIPNIKSLEEIKKELDLTSDYVQIIEETPERLSFRMEQTEHTRSDIYVQQTGEETLVLAFFTPDHDYLANYEKIEEFRKNITLY